MYLNVMYRRKNAPWHCSAKLLKQINDYIATLKIPSGWPQLSKYFSEEYERIKLAEALAFAGDRGAYFIGLTDIDEGLKKDFIDLVTVAGQFVDKAMKKADLNRLHDKLVKVLAKLEVLLPLYWNTSARHHLAHMRDTIVVCIIMLTTQYICILT